MAGQDLGAAAASGRGWPVEVAEAEVPRLVGLLVASGQATYAFAPLAMGLLRGGMRWRSMARWSRARWWARW